jgi:PAS domain S-box-containing protein
MTDRDVDIDLQAIFENAFDVIYVANGNGDTVRVSSSSKEVWGYTPDELVGRSVYDLERQGVFYPSVSRLVLEKQEKVSAIQTTKTGRRLIILGIPIKDDNGNVTRVVNVSRDITEQHNLQKELQVTKNLVEGYKEELLTLRNQSGINQKLVYRSADMREVTTIAKRAAIGDSPILISGKSGTGKKTLSHFIHEHSERNAGPILTLNCISTNNRLIYTSFQKVSYGTLILENIGELHAKHQKSLINVLHSSDANVRVIATTKKDLHREMKAGRFRKDLYFFLNVISIDIPSLRERHDDIFPLATFFLQEFNETYKQNKRLNHSLIDQFSNYDWPGNVRELKNIMERLVLINDVETIEAAHLPHYFFEHQPMAPIEVKEIIPLKEAVTLVEQLLLKKAMAKHLSTTKIADMLEIHQSNVSRKLKKYNL